LAEFHLSGGKKVVVAFLVHAKVLFSAGVPGVLRSVMEEVHAGNGDGESSGLVRFMDAILTHPEKKR